MPGSPISNPLAPPGFNPNAGAKEKPLSNADFRKIMMTPRATPGRGGERERGGERGGQRVRPVEDDDPNRPTSNPERPADAGKRVPDEDAIARQKAKQKWQQKNKEKEKEKEKQQEGPKYRDRAKERREGDNPDYAESEAQMAGFHSVPPPDDEHHNSKELQKISIENSKFLGGDMEHTHLVKGLDFALLNKVKSENVQKDKEAKEKALKEAEAKDKKLSQMMPPPSSGGKAPTLAQAIGAKKSSSSSSSSSLSSLSSSSPSVTAQTVLGKSILSLLQAAPSTNEMFQPGRMAFVFDMDPEFPQELPTTLIRSKDDCPVTSQQSLSGTLDPVLLDKVTKVMSFLRQGSGGRQKKLKKKEKSEDLLEKAPAKPAPAPPVQDEDFDIFGDAGTDYVVTVNRTTKPKEDNDVKMEERNEKPSKDEKDKKSYFAPTDQEDNEVKHTAQQALQQAKLLTAALNKVANNDEKTKEEPAKEQTAKKKDDPEKDPNFVGDTYSECYPGSYETAMYAYESDDEEDITKMDMGGSKKSKLKRWDFEDEESWNEYNDQREAMPKAAFQFGVKMSDGRKTRRNTKDKISQDVSKINTILKQRAVDAVQAKKHGGEGGGDNRAKRRRQARGEED